MWNSCHFLTVVQVDNSGLYELENNESIQKTTGYLSLTVTCKINCSGTPILNTATAPTVPGDAMQQTCQAQNNQTSLSPYACTTFWYTRCPITATHSPTSEYLSFNTSV